MCIQTLKENMKNQFYTLATLGACWLGVGCGSDNTVAAGSVTVLLESEDVVIEGLEPGSEPENIRDGWSVSFDKYLATIGDIDVHLSTDEEVEAEAEEAFVVDLTRVPSTGLALWSLSGLPAGRWEFWYATPGAAHGASPHESVDDEDYDEMVSNDWTYWVEGSMQHPSGQSCPPSALAQPGARSSNGNVSGDDECYDAPEVRFEFAAQAESTFGPCEIGDVPGFAIAPGEEQTVSATIHGDHLFFNGFPEGDEGGVLRLAQWLADCDLNLDGTVSTEELAAIHPNDLPQIDDRYQLGGSPIIPLDSMLDYVASQMKTQGHFQGEGECAVDGVAHEHEDDE